MSLFDLFGIVLLGFTVQHQCWYQEDALSRKKIPSGMKKKKEAGGMVRYVLGVVMDF